MVLYSTNCSRCKVLERKLQEKKIKYIKKTNIDEMQELGFISSPMLEIEDGIYLGFNDAIKELNNL